MASYKVETAASAVADLTSIPFPFRRQINGRIVRLKSDPRPPDSQEIPGGGGDRVRLRLGSWKVLYRVDEQARLVTIFAILPC